MPAPPKADGRAADSRACRWRRSLTSRHRLCCRTTRFLPTRSSPENPRPDLGRGGRAPPRRCL